MIETNNTAVIETDEKIFLISGYLNTEAYLEYAENNGLKLEEFEDWQEQAEDCYQGIFDNDIEFATQLLESTGDLDNDSYLSRYFDWQQFARDLMYDYFSTESGYYFSNY